MKWFKHSSIASDDYKLQRLEKVLGVNTALGIWWRFVELCSLHLEKGQPPNFQFDTTFLQNKLRLKSVRVENFLRTSSELNLFQISKLDNAYAINFPKLLEIRDNHLTRKDSTTELLQPREDKIREDKDKNYNVDLTRLRAKPTRKCSFDFLKVYEIYPRKEGKQQGLKKLQSLIKTQEDYENILIAVANYATRCEGLDKKFIKMFSTFVGTKEIQPWRDYLEAEIISEKLTSDKDWETNFLAGKD